MSLPALRDLPLKRFTIDDMNRMSLGPDPVELVDGYLVAVPDPTARAAFVRHGLAKRLEAAGLGAWVGQKRPVVAGAWDRPEADLAVVTRPHAEFSDRHLTGADVRLIVDIADDGAPAPGPGPDIAYKRARVMAYAQAGVPELWIVDLGNRRVDVYREPRGRGFTDVRILDERDVIEVSGVVFQVAAIVS